MNYFTSPNFASLNNIKHGFFGRNGGFSSGLYQSLNCNERSGDNKEIVEKNRLKTLTDLNIENHKLITLKQVHSNICVIADANSSPDVVEADGLVTNIKSIALGILTADCVPVLFADKNKNIIGACHSGWRGARFGVLENTITAMQNLGSSKSDIIAAIGPCIGPNSYEVGDDFVSNFVDEGKENEKYFKPGNRPNHKFFNLPGYVADKLKLIGLSNIETIKHDTCAEPEKFFSYRYNCLNNVKQYGCQLSVISLI